MKRKFIFLLVSIFFVSLVFGQKQITLPNGWSLSPAGKSLPLGDLPLNMAISNSKKLMAVNKHSS
jgi:hypothetical protein